MERPFTLPAMLHGRMRSRMGTPNRSSSPRNEVVFPSLQGAQATKQSRVFQADWIASLTLEMTAKSVRRWLWVPAFAGTTKLHPARIIRGLARDGHVVDVAFAQARTGDADELR